MTIAVRNPSPSFPRTLFVSTANGRVTNSIAESSLVGSGAGSETLGAGFLLAGRTLKIIAIGIYSTAALPGTLTLKVNLGSTVILNTGAQTPVGNIVDLSWRIEAVITCRTVGSSGTVIGQSAWQNLQAALGSPFWFEMSNLSAVTVDTTVSQAVRLTAQWDTADVANDIRCTNFILKVLN